jgi:RES domain-containing protein
MALADLVVAWSGDVLRHRPRASSRSVLEDTYLGIADDNRWSARGVRAYYFASDVGVVGAEHARHIAIDVPGGHEDRIERSVFKVPVVLDRLLTLSDSQVITAMGAAPLNEWILDTGATQAAASYLIAHVRGLQGLIVPSVAFLDRPDRFNLVVYRDAIDLESAFGTPTFEMDIVLTADGA